MKGVFNIFHLLKPKHRKDSNALTIPLQAAIDAVEAEPELPGEMPDDMWDAIAGGRELTQSAMRVLVRTTKRCIKERLLKIGAGLNVKM